MKKEQIFVSNNDRTDFNRRVNEFLRDGYTVIPGTFQICVAICPQANYIDKPGHTNSTTIQSYGVFLEKIET